MVKRVKKTIFMASLLVCFSSVAMAQSSQTITASATVVSDISTSNLANLNFGNVVAGTSKLLSVSTLNVTANGGVTGGEKFGVVKIAFLAGQEIDIEINFPPTLSGSNESILDFNPTSDGSAGSGQNANAKLIVSTTDPGGSIGEGMPAAATGGDITDWVVNTGDPNKYIISGYAYPSSGNLYAIIGGEASAAQGAVRESYTGNITVTASVKN